MALRIPTTLAVVMTFVGCDRGDGARVAVDARRDSPVVDARHIDAGVIDSEQVAPPDALFDAASDSSVDAPDAGVVDAYVAVDAAVDAPHV